MVEQTAAPVLITFPPSLDSELARFLLQHYEVSHVERRHTLVFSTFVTLWHGGTAVFPLLYSSAYALEGPRAIAEHFDAACRPELRLVPQDVSKEQVNADWEPWNGVLAFATAAFAYYHLLPHRDRMLDPLSLGTPAFERKAVKAAYPVFAWLLRKLLRLSPARAEEALGQIRSAFDRVDSRLAGGSRYLVGDGLTLSDLAFAVAAAPVVLPETYGGPIPPLAEMPGEIQAVVAEMRARPAGAFALRIYREERRGSALDSGRSSAATA